VGVRSAAGWKKPDGWAYSSCEIVRNLRTSFASFNQRGSQRFVPQG
jgi:hypothetical protein